MDLGIDVWTDHRVTDEILHRAIAEELRLLDPMEAERVRTVEPMNWPSSLWHRIEARMAALLEEEVQRAPLPVDGRRCRAWERGLLDGAVGELHTVSGGEARAYVLGWLEGHAQTIDSVPHLVQGPHWHFQCVRCWRLAAADRARDVLASLDERGVQ